MTQITAWGELALRHWKEFRPNMVAFLTKNESLEDALVNAQENAKTEMTLRLQRGEHFHQAKEATLGYWIFLPSEKEVPILDPDRMPFSQPGE